MGDAPYVRVFRVWMRSGLKSGWASSMAIIVGTMTVWLIPYSSMRSRTSPGLNSGMNTEMPPYAGMPRMAATDAAWNIGVWCR